MTGGQRTLDDFTDLDNGDNRAGGAPTATDLARRVEDIEERMETVTEMAGQLDEQLDRLLDALGGDDSSVNSGGGDTDDTNDTLRMFQ